MIMRMIMRSMGTRLRVRSARKMGKEKDMEMEMVVVVKRRVGNPSQRGQPVLHVDDITRHDDNSTTV